MKSTLHDSIIITHLGPLRCPCYTENVTEYSKSYIQYQCITVTAVAVSVESPQPGGGGGVLGYISDRDVQMKRNC